MHFLHLILHFQSQLIYTNLQRYDEKYSGGGDWIVVEAKMELVKVEGKEVILRGEVMHIWKKENDEWLMFYEQYHVDN